MQKQIFKNINYFLPLFMALILSKNVHSAEVISEQLSPAQIQQWERNRFDDPELHTIEVDQPENVDFTHGLKLNAVVFRNAGWNNLQDVAAHFQRTAEIYSKCGIKITDIKLILVSGETMINENMTESIAARTPAYFKRPTIYFASKVSDRHHAYAWSGAEACKNNAAKCNTAWISSMVNTQRYKEGRKREYNVVAHELAHIVGDYDHTKGINGNILGEYQEGGAGITNAQCNKFKTFSEMEEF